MPPSNVGMRDRLRVSTGTDEVRDRYEAHLTDLADYIEAHPAQLVIGDDASLVFAYWDQDYEYRTREGSGDLEHIAEWVGKLRASVLRLAGLLHLAQRCEGNVIDLDTMKDAITIGEYFVGHICAISARWGMDEVSVKARKVADWIIRTQPAEITLREVMRNNRRLFEDADSVLPALQLLVDHHWLRPMFDGPISLGRRGREPQRFAPHPDVVQMSRNVAHPTPEMSPNVADIFDVAEMSRMSRMSRKGGFQSPPTSVSDTDSQPPTPGDMRDMRDISPNPTESDVTLPNDPTGLFE